MNKLIDIDFQINVSNNSNDIMTIVYNDFFWDWCYVINSGNLNSGIFYDFENVILKRPSNKAINKILDLKYKGNFWL